MKLSLDLSLAFPEIAEFYNVGFCGCPVGRVWLARDRVRTDQAWDWLISLPMTLPEASKGSAGSRNEAMGALASALAGLIAATPVARLQRAFDFAIELERRAGPSPAAGLAPNPSLGARLADLHAELAQRRSQSPTAEQSLPAATAVGARPVELTTTPVAPAAAEHTVATAPPEAHPEAPPAVAPSPKPPVKKSITLSVSPPAPSVHKPVKVITQKPAVVIQPAQAAAKLEKAASSPPIAGPTPAINAPAPVANPPKTAANPVRQPLSLSGSLNLKMNQAKPVMRAAGAAAPAKNTVTVAGAPAAGEGKQVKAAIDTPAKQEPPATVPPQAPSVAASAPAATPGQLGRAVVVGPREPKPTAPTSPQQPSSPMNAPAFAGAVSPAASIARPKPVSLTALAAEIFPPTNVAVRVDADKPAAAEGSSAKPLLASPHKQAQGSSGSPQTPPVGEDVPAAAKAELPAVALRGDGRPPVTKADPGLAEAADALFAPSENRAMLKDIETLLARHA